MRRAQCTRSADPRQPRPHDERSAARARQYGLRPREPASFHHRGSCAERLRSAISPACQLRAARSSIACSVRHPQPDQTPGPAGTCRTLCVRTCDGFISRSSYSTLPAGNAFAYRKQFSQAAAARRPKPGPTPSSSSTTRPSNGATSWSPRNAPSSSRSRRSTPRVSRSSRRRPRDPAPLRPACAPTPASANAAATDSAGDTDTSKRHASSGPTISCRRNRP